MRILAINPGSTSTKIALFDDTSQVWDDAQRYPIHQIRQFPSISAQEEFRFIEIKKILEVHNTDPSSLDAIVGRGGLLKPIPGGTYIINDVMLDDLRSCRYGSHACNLGAPLAFRLAQECGCGKAYTVDPVVVDEMIPEARLSGLPEIERRSLFHALNQKAVARHASSELGKEYKECSFIVAHMGGGISVGAHDHGRVIDVNNALDGEGPFTPERSGSLPAGTLVHLAFSGQYDLNGLLRRLVGEGGIVAYLGTNDLREVLQMIEAGDAKAALIFEALAYQIAKEIGASSAVLKGLVDGIILTGGLAYSESLVEKIRKRVSFIAPVFVYPGEDELRALAEGTLRVLTGQEKPREYR